MSVSEDVLDLKRVSEEFPDLDSLSGRKKAKGHPMEVEKALRKIYSEEFETFAIRRKKVLLKDLRRGMADVRALFPDLTEMQVRDKL